MTISQRTETFHGCEVTDFDWCAGISDPGHAQRISIEYEEFHEGSVREVVQGGVSPRPHESLWHVVKRLLSGRPKPIPRPYVRREGRPVLFSDKLEALCADSKSGEVRALIAGPWENICEADNSGAVVKALVAAKAQLSQLEALFIGDITFDECEMSWINQGNMEPLWAAYPNLIEFRVRGGNDLSLGTMNHPTLRRLIVETGGLPANILEEVGRAKLPELEHLELWLGDDGYGWCSNLELLNPILSGKLFPRLRYLGLRNSCEADTIAELVAEAPLLDQLEILDLSLGTLGDAGAAALAASPKVARLKMLDIHHHYATEKELEPLRALGIELNADDRQEADDDDDESCRYVSVGE